MKPEEIFDLAIQRLAGNVTFSQDVPDEMLEKVFMPLLFMTELDRTEMIRKVGIGDISEIYGINSEAGPRSVNGFPIFVSYRTINRKDIDAVVAKIKELKWRRASYAQCSDTIEETPYLYEPT